MLRRNDHRIRIVAGLCLAVLACSWAPHAHSIGMESGETLASPSSVGETRQDSVSADETHEEHSSGSPGEVDVCVFCRSSEEREIDRTPVHETISMLGSVVQRADDFTFILPAALSGHLHPTRGPPAA